MVQIVGFYRDAYWCRKPRVFLSKGGEVTHDTVLASIRVWFFILHYSDGEIFHWWKSILIWTYATDYSVSLFFCALYSLICIDFQIDEINRWTHFYIVFQFPEDFYSSCASDMFTGWWTEIFESNPSDSTAYITISLLHWLVKKYHLNVTWIVAQICGRNHSVSAYHLTHAPSMR